MGLSPRGVPTLNPCSMGCCLIGVHDIHTFPLHLHRPLLQPPGSDLIPFLIKLSLPFITVRRDVSFGARINMCFRIKLVQRFLTTISQKLSPDNLFGWSRASETLRDGKRRTLPEPSGSVSIHPVLLSREAPREHAAPWPRSGLVLPGTGDFTHHPGNKTSQTLGHLLHPSPSFHVPSL